MTTPNPQTERCGVVALVGLPNAGKSTLLNACVGQKVSIVTSKVQTTRTLIRGIALHDGAQIIFVDTPGIFTTGKQPLEKAMVEAAYSSLDDVDVIVVVADVRRAKPEDLEPILKRLAASKQQAVLLLNKIDLVPEKEKLLPLIQTLHDTGHFQDVLMVSAQKGKGVEDFLTYLTDRLPEGPWLYPEDQVSDAPQRFLAAEITREKLFMFLQQELPYALTVETEDWERFRNGSIRLQQVIYVQRDSQKSIILGKGGQMIRKVGEVARKELQEMLEVPVHLKLFVKVDKNWQNHPERYKAMGLDLKG